MRPMPGPQPASVAPATPADPIAAVIHPDPAPYYADLALRQPFAWDAGLDLWVAASAPAVEATLGDPACRVRPRHEPVPAALLGTTAAEIFARLVRFDDGPRHRPTKQAVTVSLDALAPARLAATCARHAAALAPHTTDPAAVTRAAFTAAPAVLLDLLGLPSLDAAATAHRLAAYTAGVAPGAGADAVADAGAAAHTLLVEVGARVAHGAVAPDGLLAGFAAAARSRGVDDPAAIAANAVGLLTQAYDATAGLIGNTLLALARDPSLSEAVVRHREPLAGVVAEVARLDPPVHNTRRFVERETRIAGERLRPGDAVLVVLAAANLDAAANRLPLRFDTRRAPRRVFTFGAATHACPGERVANAVAVAMVGELLARDVDLGALATRFHYAPSGNLRVPRFSG